MRILKSLLMPFTFVLAATIPISALAMETAIVQIVLNREPKGEYFVKLTKDGDYLLRQSDLRAMGFREPAGAAEQIDGEPYRSLRSMPGVRFTLNEREIALEITAPPDLLAFTVLDFAPPQHARIYRPADTSAFLNYGASYADGAVDTLNVTSQLGARQEDFLFLTDGSYTRTDGKGQWARLMSNLTLDRRDAMQRLVAGDQFATSGDLGSTVPIGGIAFSKVYRINPYFINRPTLDITGAVPLPSEADIYLDGIRVRTERLSPGEFELKNILRHGGAGAVEIVIRDMFGREQRLKYPFYAAETLLRKGLHEYSYQLGFERRELGNESFRYGSPAILGFHRYGISDNLTLGLRGEAMEDLVNFGPQATLLLGRGGVATFVVAGSRDDSGTGLAGSMDYAFQGAPFSARLLLRGFTRDYATIGSRQSMTKPRYELDTGVSYNSSRLGGLSLSYTSSGAYGGQDRQVASATYSRGLTGSTTLLLTFRRVMGQENANELFAGITWFPGQGHSVSTAFEKRKDADTETLQLQKNTPVGEGTGYRLAFQRSASEGSTTYSVNPFLQYNTPWSILSGDYKGRTSDEGTDGSWQLSAAGGLAYVGGYLGFSRPVDDSFGLVKVGNVGGVRVYHDNHEIGRTDATGTLFVPNLRSYYNNFMSINDKDVPINYAISDVARYISPPLRSGSCVIFGATRLQPLAGALKTRESGVLKPLEYQSFILNVNGRDLAAFTGSNGEFYLEGLPAAADDLQSLGCAAMDLPAPAGIQPGIYQGSFEYQGKRRDFSVTVPKTDAIVVELGEIVVDLATATERTPTPPGSAEAPPAPSGSPAGAGREKAVTPHHPKPAEVDKRPLEIEVHFAFDTDRIVSNSDRALLMTAARLLDIIPGLRAEIEGHTDQLGSHKYNRRLGKKRARAMARILTGNRVAADRIAALRSHGKTRPKCRGNDEDCRQENRRGVIRLGTYP